MSENKVRYFRHLDGSVAVAADGTDVNFYAGNRSWTEVQVVPLDAIVIRRESLPGATRGEYGGHRAGKVFTPGDFSIAEVEAARDGYAAIAEYLREHPPVDEAQVKAVRDALIASDDDDVNYIEGDDAWKIARRLVERGVRVEQS